MWLIQGDLGTGKSIFLKIIEKKFWNLFKKGYSNYFTIFIRLSEIKNPYTVIKRLFRDLGCRNNIADELIKKSKE